LYRKDNRTPDCRRPSGCPVEDLATDIDLNEAVSKFVNAKMLYEYNGIPEIARQVYEELGLLEDLDALLNMESSFRLYQINATKKEQEKNKWKTRRTR